MWQVIFLAALGIASANEREIPRQNHLYSPDSNGPQVLEYEGEPTLHCSPDMFPPGLKLQLLSFQLFKRSKLRRELIDILSQNSTSRMFLAESGGCQSTSHCTLHDDGCRCSVFETSNLIHSDMPTHWYLIRDFVGSMYQGIWFTS